MAYVPWCKFDIFISYSHINNNERLGGDKGWVSNFKNELSEELATGFGNNDIKIFFDLRDLSHHEEFSPEIEKNLQNTAILLVVLSEGLRWTG